MAGKSSGTDRLDSVEQQIVDLLNERYALVEAEAGTAGAVLPPGVVTERLAALQARNGGPMPAGVLQAVFREVWGGDLVIRKPVGVAFLGPEATYSHQAAMVAFGSNVGFVEQPTIADVFDAVSRGEVAYGVVPVENSTEGSVTYTLDMFADTELKITAELNLPIHHCLLSQCEVGEIEVLYSHSQVLGQCRRWLYRNMPNIKMVEVSSTTEAAARAAQDATAGAIASALAADKYALPIRDRHIEDNTDNTTRFLMLGTEAPAPTGDDKTSVLLAIRHVVGALYDSLLPFGRNGVNLTFIESRPSKRKNWEYYFFIDLIGHVSEPRVKKTLAELAENCQFVKILGSYPKATEAK